MTSGTGKVSSTSKEPEKLLYQKRLMKRKQDNGKILVPITRDNLEIEETK
jgi:hypothetical protein